MRAWVHSRHWSNRHGPTVRLEMTQDEFREHVEWLEMIQPRDGCTRDFRAQYDRLFPEIEEEDNGDQAT